MKKLSLIYLFGVALTLMSCKGVVNPNEWVIATTTCWNDMWVLEAGEAIPRLYTPCDRMIILPASYLSADFETETKFKNRVAGIVNITYRWRISDPTLFIQTAKSVISSPTSGDKKIDPDALEAIENSVVDKMLIDVVREYTPNKDAGIDELQVEKDLQGICSQKMGERGVEFANMSVNITFTEQIEQALDVSSALEVYKAKGIEEFGKQVILEKAGAPTIILNNIENKEQ